MRRSIEQRAPIMKEQKAADAPKSRKDELREEIHNLNNYLKRQRLDRDAKKRLMEARKEYKKELRLGAGNIKEIKEKDRMRKNVIYLIVGLFDHFSKTEFTDSEFLFHLKKYTGIEFKTETLIKHINYLEKIGRGEKGPVLHEEGKFILKKDSPYFKDFSEKGKKMIEGTIKREHLEE